MEKINPSLEAQLQADRAAAEQATAERIQTQQEFEAAMARSRAAGERYATEQRAEAGVVDGRYGFTKDQLDVAKEVVSSGDAGSKHFARLNWLNNGGEEPKLKYGRDESAAEADVREPVQADPSAAGKELVLVKPVSKELVPTAKPASDEVAHRDPSQGKGFYIVNDRTEHPKSQREQDREAAEAQGLQWNDTPRRFIGDIDRTNGTVYGRKKPSLEEVMPHAIENGDRRLAAKVTELEDVYAKLIAANSRKFMQNRGSVKIQISRGGRQVTEKYKQSEIEDVRQMLMDARAEHRDSIRRNLGDFPDAEVDNYFNQVEPYQWAAKLSGRVAELRVENSKKSKFVQKWATQTFNGEGRFGKYLRLAIPGYGQWTAMRVARNMAGAKVGDETVADIQHKAFLTQLDGELEGLNAREADDHVARDLRYEIGTRNVERNKRRLRTSIELGALTTAVALTGVRGLNALLSNDVVASAQPAAGPAKAVPLVTETEKPLGHLDVNAGTVNEKWVWGHFANEYSPNEASGKIAEAVAKAKEAGYDINGWIGQRDGSRAPMTLDALQDANPNKFGFNSIVAPDGHVYDSQKEMAALLDKFSS